ncbi:MAG TPA: hypothetical protein VFR31_09800 [Thermoanaerobaculia bacterium]|nr:hypothetical protein [Thermoanaerobaculia bacterium]
MPTRTLTLSFATLLFVATAAFSAEDSPSLAEAESAIRSALVKTQGEASVKDLKIRGLHGCYPLAGRPASDLVCLVEMTGRDGEFRTQEIPFRRSGSSWTFLNPDEVDMWPACPGKEEAQRAFRAIKKLDSLVVIDVPDEGQLTDERGSFEKVKAPWSLMCVYGVETKLIGEQTYVAYIKREGGKYVFDPEIEVWLD